MVTVGQEACQKGPSPPMEAVHLKDHLATNPSEYSYFDSHLISAWAGPAHWKIRPLSKSMYDIMYDIFLFDFALYRVVHEREKIEYNSFVIQ